MTDEIEGKQKRKHHKRKRNPQRRKKWLNLCSFVDGDILGSTLYLIERLMFSGHAEITSKFGQFVGFNTPCHLLDVEFAEDKKANLGNILTITLDENTPAPKVKYSEAKDGKTYELLMVDYDRLRNREEDWVVWHEASVPGTIIKAGFDASAKEIQGKTFIGLLCRF